MSRTRLSVRVPHADLTVERVGSGPAVLFVHGFGGDLKTWELLWNRLDVGRTLIGYDLRGYGGSKALDDDGFSYSADLLNLIDALDIAVCDVVGLSMGGGIALSLALDHPGRVRTVSLISPAIMGWEWTEDWRILWRPASKAARSGDMEEARRQWWLHPMFASTRASPAAEFFREEVSRFAGRQWIEDRQTADQSDMDRLETLSVPALLLTGPEDHVDFRTMADVIEARAPGLTRMRHQAAGHLLHLDDPDWCADRLAEFWATHSR